MSQGPLCPNLTKKFQIEVSQMANRNFICPMLIGGLSVNLNHLKMEYILNKSCVKPRTVFFLINFFGGYEFFLWGH